MNNLKQLTRILNNTGYRWRKIGFFSCCLLFIILISGCKKFTPTYYYIDNSFKAWTVFQIGSYWVYLNENSQLPDSTYISAKPDSGYNPPVSQDADHYEFISYQVTNGFYQVAEICKEQSDSYLLLGGFYPRGFWFYVLNSYMTTGPTSISPYSLYVVERLDTLRLNNNLFTNIIHTRDTDYYEGSWKHDYYFAKNIGLVKFSVKTSAFDSTWSLMRWHVIE